MTYQHFPLGMHQIILNDQGQVLLLKRSMTRSFLPGYWGLPSGHHDGGQSVEESAAREALEEVGVTVDLAHQRLAVVAHTHVGLECINFFCLAKKYTGVPKNCEPTEADEVGWFDPETLPQPIAAFVAHGIRTALSNPGLVYLDLPTTLAFDPK